jgi:hypothetical protein
MGSFVTALFSPEAINITEDALKGQGLIPKTQLKIMLTWNRV